MKIMKLKCMLTVLTLMVCSHTRTIAGEGNGSSGGGDVIICKNKVYLADTFDLRNTAYMNYYASLTEAEIVTALENSLGIENFANTYRKLQYLPVEKVAELDDDNIITFEKGCKKQQLAVQNIQDAKVEYSEKLHRKLSRLDQILFKVHETVISLKKNQLENINDTTSIRNEVKKPLADYDTFARLLAEAAKNVKVSTKNEKIRFLTLSLIGTCQGAYNCDPTDLTIDKIKSGEIYTKQMFRKLNDYQMFALTFSRVLDSFYIILKPNSIEKALEQELLIDAINEMSKQAIFDVKF
jgi:hypothetical protein